jgi:hypothetical protein
MTTTTLLSPSAANGSAQLAKTVYQTDHQIKLLSLHADAESLLQQLRSIKQQRNTADHSHN